MSSSSGDPVVERAYVACGYLLGHRGADLVAGLAGASPGVPLAADLEHPDQTQRARALASALAEVARALRAQRLR